MAKNASTSKPKREHRFTPPSTARNRIRSILAESTTRFRPNKPNEPQHFLEAQQLDRSLLTELFALAEALEKDPPQLLKGKFIYWYSDEASSRTRSSFSAAVRHLGGDTEEIVSSESSEKKGEPLDDTVRAFCANGADLVALRYHDVYSIYRAAMVSSVPIVNGGSGTGQHPTQAATDALTIFRKLGRLDDIRIAFVGDVGLSRVVHSDLYLLSKFTGNKIFIVSPDHLRINGNLRYYLDEKGIDVTETSDLDWVLPQVDVVYQTRAQLERVEGDKAQFKAALSNYCIDRKAVQKMKKGAGVMHPLPHNDELAKELDDTEWDWYHDQMAYGMHMRTAILAKILGKLR